MTNARTKNPYGKTRKVDEPYMVWKTPDGSWEWRVLKTYQTEQNEAKNPYARWFCAVFSPITREQMSSGYELGDCYVSDIKGYAYRVKDMEGVGK